MAKTQGISRKKLNSILKKLPKPIIEHSERCKQLAKYFLMNDSCFSLIPTGLKFEDIQSSIYYHDIGKVQIQSNTLHLAYCANKEQRAEYWRHIDTGVDVVEKECGVKLSTFKENSFENLVYLAITQHHERIDGSGHNQISDLDLSFIGRFAQVIDFIDNQLFVGKKESEELNFDNFFENIDNESGKSLDNKIIDGFLNNRDEFKTYCEGLIELHERVHDRDKYGTRIRFDEIENMESEKTDSFFTRVDINDLYYGFVKQAVYIPVAEKLKKTSILQKAGFEKLCIHLEHFYFRALVQPVCYYTFQISNFLKKNFLKDLLKILGKYKRVPQDRIVICLSEDEVKGYLEQIPQIISNIREAGFKVCLTGFTDQVSLLTDDRYKFDDVIFSRDYGEKVADNPKQLSMLKGMISIIETVEMKLICSGVVSGKVEEVLLRAGIKYGYGSVTRSNLEYKHMLDILEEDNDED